MMRGGKPGHRSLRETVEANARALEFYAAAAPEGKRDIHTPCHDEIGEKGAENGLIVAKKPPNPEDRQSHLIERKETRKPANPLERAIRRDIVAAIRARADCVFVGEFNRGMSVERAIRYAGGAYQKPITRYIRFNTVAGFPDIHGLLKRVYSGAEGTNHYQAVPFYIEVKRARGGRLEPDQRDFLFLARTAGALAGVATSVAEAHALLDGNAWETGR